MARGLSDRQNVLALNVAVSDQISGAPATKAKPELPSPPPDAVAADVAPPIKLLSPMIAGRPSRALSGAHSGALSGALGVSIRVPIAGVEGHRARMRQKLLNAGPDGVLDHEMLEMVLFLAMPRRDTKPLARALLARFGSFAATIAAPVPALGEIDGVGEAVIAALKIVQAAALRLARAEAMMAPILKNWDALIAYLTIAMARDKIEQFRVIFLDAKNRIVADEAQARGTVNHTPVYPREVVRRALELHASALVLSHNHPSGDPTPSEDDIVMTKRIEDAAKVFGIAVHDHVIIGNGKWMSFRKEGFL